MSEIDYTEIRDNKIRTKICDLMSAMLDNPDENGIYPTSKFMWHMETYILVKINAARKNSVKELEVALPVCPPRTELQEEAEVTADKATIAELQQALKQLLAGYDEHGDYGDGVLTFAEWAARVKQAEEVLADVKEKT